MALRWIICPVVTSAFVPGYGISRHPRVVELVDAGLLPVPGVDDEGLPTLLPKTYAFSAAISDGQAGQVNDWCLCLVRYVDPFSLNTEALATPTTFLNVLERDYEDAEAFLARSPVQENWSNQRINRLRNLVNQRGASVSGLTGASAFWEWLARLGSIVRPGFEPRGTWVG